MIDILVRLVMLWTFGLFGGLIFKLILGFFGRIKVEGYDKNKLTPPEEGILVVFSNHPTLWEVFALPIILFFPYYLFDRKFVPYSVPDRTNFGQIWFWFIKPFVIPLERKRQGKLIADVKSLIKNIRKIKTLIIFPEGGRTFKGKRFKFINGKGEIVTTDSWEEVKDKPGKIRTFDRGIELILKRNQVKLIPIWVDIGKNITPNPAVFPKYPYFLSYKFWRKAKIIIGEPITIEKAKTRELEDILLKLSQMGTP